NRVQRLEEVGRPGKGLELFPTSTAKILIDNHYLMASLGVLSKRYPLDALMLMKQSMEIK
ncbi:MAG: mismatch repair protein MutL, partial [Clostridia bacterium]|nr:mismatch repair protein MutL [Clostridia bacterium]